jgi:hypothetical protein
MLHSLRRSQLTFPHLQHTRVRPQLPMQPRGHIKPSTYVMHVQSPGWKIPGGPRASAPALGLGFSPPSPSGRGVWQRLHELLLAKLILEQLRGNRGSKVLSMDGQDRRHDGAHTQDWGRASPRPTCGLRVRPFCLSELLNLIGQNFRFASYKPQQCLLGGVADGCGGSVRLGPLGGDGLFLG